MRRATKRALEATGRSPERLRAHWEVERELAARLRNAGPEERSRLYGEVYDELFRRVPDHPQLVVRHSGDPERRAVAGALALVRRFLPRDGVFLEIGAGDCALSLAVAPHASKVIAIDVSREIAAVSDPPENFELLITDGRSIPVPPGSIDLVYSNQLMEHLHPDDAEQQLTDVFDALRPGGRYICLTPNRLLGPADISMFFVDDVAEGFHLREYSNGDLREVMHRAGFGDVRVIASYGRDIRAIPAAPIVALERGFSVLPPSLRRQLKHARLVKKAIYPGGGVIATKH